MSETPDSEGLIENNIYAQVPQQKYTIYRYIVLKCLPLFFLYLFSFLFAEQKTSNMIRPVTKALFIFTFSMVEFWLHKNSDGLELIGMRWYHHIEDNGEAKIVCYARADPYVPNATIFHLFWALSYGTTICWFLTIILSLFLFSTLTEFCLSCFCFALELTNLIYFKKCNNEWQKQTDDIARTIMLADAFNSDNEDDDKQHHEKENEEEAPTIVIDQ